MNKIKGSPKLASLTVDQFFDLQEQKNQSQIVKTTDSKRYVYGINGLRSILNCSRGTAQNLKSSGRISYAQNGRKLIFDVDLVLSELSINKKSV